MPRTSSPRRMTTRRPANPTAAIVVPIGRKPTYRSLREEIDVTENKKLRAAVYVRQSVAEDQGIKQQVADCRAEVKRRKWSLNKAHIFKDNNTSASRERGEHTGWSRMLAAYDRGEFDVLVVAAVDRLTRRIVDVLELRPPKRDVRIVTIRGGIDTADGSDLALGVIVLVAQEELKNKGQRAERFKSERRALGHPTPGRVPYGYRWVPKLQRDAKETRYEIQPEEAAAIRYMFSEFLAVSSASRTTIAAICRDLNNGTAMLDGKELAPSTRTTRQGKRWGTSTVRRLLISPFPAALLPPKMAEGKAYDPESFDLSECTPGAWQSIVSADQVAAARHILLRPQRRTHDGNVTRKWLLTGIARCQCGEGIRSGVTKERYRSYRGQCGHFQRRAEIIDTYVVEAVISALSAPGLLERVDESAADIAALRAALLAAEGKISRAVELWRNDTFSDAELATEKMILQAEISAISAQIAEATKGDPLAPFVTAEDVRKLWEGMSLARRQTVIRTLFDAVVIHSVGKGVRATLEAPRVTLDWSAEAVRRFSFDTGKPYMVPQLSEGQKDALSAALNG